MKRLLQLTLLLISLTLSAQDFNKQKLDSLFTLIEDNEKGMGSISIFQDNKEVYQQTYGYADVEPKFKPNADTKYRIGSITKMFTAITIMQLVEEGKLTLDVKLNTFYREIPNAGKITIEQMLRHRSGIFNFTNATDYTSWMEQATCFQRGFSKKNCRL